MKVVRVPSFRDRRTRRRTTLPRLVLAFVAGLAAASIASTLALAVLNLFRVNGLTAVKPFDLPVIGSLVGLAGMLVFGVPLWAIAWWRMAKIGTACAAAMIIGAVATFLFYYNSPPGLTGFNPGGSTGVILVSLGIGLVATVTAAAVWIVAYPRSLNEDRAMDELKVFD